MGVVYTNRNRKKYIAIGGLVAIVVIVAVVLFFLLSGNNNESTLKNFYAQISEKKYEDMYNSLSSESQKSYDQQTFVERNQNIYEGIEASNFQIEVTDETDNELTYNVKMNTIAGEVTFENKTTIEDGKIVWDDSFIFPDLTQNDRVRVSEDEAIRGQILDRNGKMLAGQGEAYSVGLVRGKLNGENDYDQLAELLGLTKESIQKTMSASWIQDDSFVPLTTIPSTDTQLENQLLQIPGVQLNTVEVRTYPYGEVTSHLTGYMQQVTAEDLEKHQGEGYTETSMIGRSGIEAAYEKQLKGTNGATISIVDENGSTKSTVATQEKQDGQDITLTIDIDLQRDLYNAFDEDQSASVAMNPTNGEVLALVSTPSFDSNDFIYGFSTEEWDDLNNDEDQPLTNRFRATWVPGSTMKSITAAIGLETDSLDASKDFGAEMKWQKDSSWGDYFVTTLHAPNPNNLRNALIYSDNVYFAKAALEIGKDNLEKGYKSLMIGEDIPFELALTKSQYTSDSFDDEILIADSGYGQGQILMNPVQMTSIYSSFMNDGKMMTPHVVKSTETSVWAEPFSKETTDEIKSDLIQVVEDNNGTAYALNNSQYQLAAKTGTGEIKDSQDDTTGTELGWLSVASTDSSKPIVITTMVEDVKGRGGSNYVVNGVKQPLMSYLQK
ncbi:penicillin-binding transpeptidase domain-containing protein [Massilimicrobiota sp. SW1139]|uniref:penicillin-binding transpeptidase domain-containing protein n=1 Tax=Massilimicrobiota sp. SW1139 TaxID=2530043 RepID=UPI00143A8C68|nr:penicillin-binding transpeptidase domain-containing protein [Massilimicrobiota sp. SW1139]NJE44088.1 penicillin-binding transpeptidase domain-containing protein [Massilimicrobiota sp. SW1139]